MESIFNKDLNLIKKSNNRFKINKRYISYLFILLLIFPIIVNEIAIFKLKRNYGEQEIISKDLNHNINLEIAEENKKIEVINEKLNKYLLFDRALEGNLEIIILNKILFFENVYFKDIKFGNTTYLSGYCNSKEDVFDYADYLKSSIDFQFININNIDLLNNKYHFEIEIIFGGDSSE